MTAKKDSKKNVQTTTAPAPAPATPETAKPVATIGKQTQTLQRLKDAWANKGINLETIKVVADGKFLNVRVAEGWPLIVIGASGGINLPEIKSYPKAFDAAIIADQLLAKQLARSQKKTAPPAPAIKTKPTEKQEVRQQA